MGVDTERFTTVDHPPHEGPLRVLAIGRLVEKKGIANAITAVSRAADSGVDIALTVVGDGPLRQGLEHLATSRRAPVTFVGSVNRARVIALLEESDVLLAPSVTAADGDTEGIPVSIMEAMSCGLPVVTTRHSGIPEVVLDGVTGLLADEHDPAALAEHLVTLAADTETRLRLGAGARAFVEAECSLAVLGPQLDTIYVGVVATPRG
jgi:colanic acid/amylovoran biosynthesis glycosyltransferase